MIDTSNNNINTEADHYPHWYYVTSYSLSKEKIIKFKCNIKEISEDIENYEQNAGVLNVRLETS